MLCPVCKTELKVAERQGVEIDYCPNCRGVWLDRGELDKLIERSMTVTSYAAPPPMMGRPDYDYDDDDDYRRKPGYQQPYPPQGQQPYPAQGQPPYPAQGSHAPQPYPQKKKSFLGEIFDIFD
jgi:hypothetical protein